MVMFLSRIRRIPLLAANETAIFTAEKENIEQQDGNSNMMINLVGRLGGFWDEIEIWSINAAESQNPSGQESQDHPIDFFQFHNKLLSFQLGVTH